MSDGEIVHQVKNAPIRHDRREGKHSPDSCPSLSAASSHGIRNLGELSMFHQSERAGFGGAADVDEMFLGKRNKQRKGADCLLRCPKSFLQSTLRESKGPPALRGFPDNPREENTQSRS